MKRYLHIILLCLAVSVVLASCSRGYEKVEVTSLTVNSFTLDGSRAADLDVSLGVDNPAKDFVVEQLRGVFKADGREAGVLSASDISVEPGMGQTVRVPARVELSQGFNMFYLIGALRGGGQNAFTVDIYAKVRLHGGFGKTIEYKDMPLEELTKYL